MSITNLASYQELDDNITSLYTIDELWDNATRTFKQKKLFQVSRVSGNIVLTANKNAENYFRIVCKDPRVGCVLYKMHIENPNNIFELEQKQKAETMVAKKKDVKVYTTDYFMKEQIKYANTVLGRRLRIQGVPIMFKHSIREIPSVEYIKCRRLANGH